MTDEKINKETIGNYFRNVKIFLDKSKEKHPKSVSKLYFNNFLKTIENKNTRRNYSVSIKKFYDVCLIKDNKLSEVHEHYINEKQRAINLQIKNKSIFDKSFFGELNIDRIKEQLKDESCDT